MISRYFIPLVFCLTLLSSCSISKMRYSRGLNIRLSERFRQSDADDVGSSADEKRKTNYRFKTVTPSDTKDTFPIADDELLNNKALVNTFETDIEHNISLPAVLSRHYSAKFKSLSGGKQPTQNSKATSEQSASASRFSGFSAPASVSHLPQATGSKPLSANEEYQRILNILGLISFIVCLTFFGGPIAMLLGAFALKQFKQNPGTFKGKLFALVGFIAGLILSVYLLFFSFIALLWAGELIYLILTLVILLCIVISLIQI
jgi:hypothetical protein